MNRIAIVGAIAVLAAVPACTVCGKVTASRDYVDEKVASATNALRSEIETEIESVAPAGYEIVSNRAMSAVTSVNSKTGQVVLAASDVGALPNVGDVTIGPIVYDEGSRGDGASLTIGGYDVYGSLTLTSSSYVAGSANIGGTIISGNTDDASMSPSAGSITLKSAKSVEGDKVPAKITMTDGPTISAGESSGPSRITVPRTSHHGSSFSGQIVVEKANFMGVGLFSNKNEVVIGNVTEQTGTDAAVQIGSLERGYDQSKPAGLIKVNGSDKYGGMIIVSGNPGGSTNEIVISAGETRYVPNEAYGPDISINGLKVASSIKDIDSTVSNHEARIGSTSVSVGGSATSKGISTIAIGYMSNANASHAIAIGGSAAASKDYAISIGGGYATNDCSVVIGASKRGYPARIGSHGVGTFTVSADDPSKFYLGDTNLQSFIEMSMSRDIVESGIFIPATGGVVRASKDRGAALTVDSYNISVNDVESGKGTPSAGLIAVNGALSGAGKIVTYDYNTNAVFETGYGMIELTSSHGTRMSIDAGAGIKFNDGYRDDKVSIDLVGATIKGTGRATRDGGSIYLGERIYGDAEPAKIEIENGTSITAREISIPGYKNSEYPYPVTNGIVISSGTFSDPDNFTDPEITIGTVGVLASITSLQESASSSIHFSDKNSVDISYKLDNYPHGVHAFAHGICVAATNDFSHAEGDTTCAFGYGSHAEGRDTKATGTYSHAEGQSTVASGNSSHADGYGAVASNEFSYAWSGTIAGGGSHGDGTFSIYPNGGISGFYIDGKSLADIISVDSGTFLPSSWTNGMSVSAGLNATASRASVAIGWNACASNTSAVALGSRSKALHENSLSFGSSAKSTGYNSVAIGTSSEANQFSVAIGYEASATGHQAVAIGRGAKAYHTASIAIGPTAETTGDATLRVAYNPSEIMLGAYVPKSLRAYLDEITPVIDWGIASNIVEGAEFLRSSDYAVNGSSTVQVFRTTRDVRRPLFSSSPYTATYTIEGCNPTTDERYGTYRLNFGNGTTVSHQTGSKVLFYGSTIGINGSSIAINDGNDVYVANPTNVRFYGTVSDKTGSTNLLQLIRYSAAAATDDLLPAWAKAANKPTYTASEVGAYTKAQTDSELAAKADKSAISAADPTFSKAVLAVGLNIDTNSVAVLNEIASAFGGFPIEGTATTVGGLLAALAAAIAWLKRNKADKTDVDTLAAKVGDANEKLEEVA